MGVPRTSITARARRGVDTERRSARRARWPGAANGPGCWPRPRSAPTTGWNRRRGPGPRAGAELVIAGGPPRAGTGRRSGAAGLVRLADSGLSVSDRLMFTGRVTGARIPALLRSADLFVHVALRRDVRASCRWRRWRAAPPVVAAPGGATRTQSSTARPACWCRRVTGGAGPPDPAAAGQPDAARRASGSQPRTGSGPGTRGSAIGAETLAAYRELPGEPVS